jgi:hypothetical protein
MTTHELAKKLLELPNLPVCMSDRDGDLYEISEQHVYPCNPDYPYSPDGTLTPFRGPPCASY